jgi:phosphoribosyl 1,2-cyclic phosphodiesterase
MIVRFLGTGASPAMPIPFCSCRACTTARRHGGRELRKRSSVLIDDALLIDLGPDIAAASFQHGVPLEGVHFCLQTHPHEDHFDPEFLISRHIEYATEQNGRLELVGSRKTLEAMDAVITRRCDYGSILRDSGQHALGVSVQVAQPFQAMRVGPYTVLPYPANHAPNSEALLYSISDGTSTVFYGADSAVIEDSVWRDAMSRGVAYDLVVLDHTYGIGQPSTDHLAALDVAACATMLREQSLLKPNGRVLATHLSHEALAGDTPLDSFAEAHGYELAWDGLRIQL